MTNKTANPFTEKKGKCLDCGASLPIPRHVAKKFCSICLKSYQHSYYHKNKDRVREKNRRYYSEHAEEMRAYAREHVASLPKREYQERRRRYSLKRRFGFSSDQYVALLFKQGGGCAICGKKPNGGRLFPIDHDHACCPNRESCCGKCIRGILCFHCNVLVGYLEKDKNLIPTCQAYLAKANAQ